jgi:hypothetical protein
MPFFVAACTVTNGRAGRGTESILYAPRPLKVEQDPTPYYPHASKRAKETREVILHFRIGTAGELRFNLTIGETQHLNSASSLLGI